MIQTRGAGRGTAGPRWGWAPTPPGNAGPRCPPEGSKARVPPGLRGGRRLLDALETHSHRCHGPTQRRLGPADPACTRTSFLRVRKPCPTEPPSPQLRARGARRPQPLRSRCPPRPPHGLPGRDERGRRPGRRDTGTVAGAPGIISCGPREGTGLAGFPGRRAPGAQPHWAGEPPPPGRRAPRTQPHGVNGVPPGGRAPRALTGRHMGQAHGVSAPQHRDPSSAGQGSGDHFSTSARNKPAPPPQKKQTKHNTSHEFDGKDQVPLIVLMISQVKLPFKTLIPSFLHSF